jgi:hypothetical protein
MSDNPAYTVHAADVDRDRELILGLWRGNLGDEARMARKYDWFYRECPYGPPLTLLLRHEESGAWVGVASAGPRQMMLGGKLVHAGVLVDLAVLPAHRSLFPALSLQMALMKAGAQRFELMYGFPNPKAAAVFKRVGYVPLCKLVRHARVLRHAGYVRRRLPALLAAPAGWALDVFDRLRLRARSAGTRGQWLEQADDTLSALWSPACAGDGPVSIRDLTFLRWRFDQSPLVDVRYLLVRDGDDRTLAWFACETRGSVLYVHDFWAARGVAGPSEAEVATLLRCARASGHTALSIELGAAAAGKGLLANGFVPREPRPVFWYPCGETLGAVAPSDLWLTAADEDE